MFTVSCIFCSSDSFFDTSVTYRMATGLGAGEGEMLVNNNKKNNTQSGSSLIRDP